MGITLKTNLNKLQKKVGIKSKKQFLKVMADTINHTAEKVVNVQRDQILKKIDRPKDFTVTGVTMFKFAKPEKARLAAVVGIKDKTAAYLKYAYTGEKEFAIKSAKTSPVGAGKQRRDKFGGILIKKKGLRASLNKTGTRKQVSGSRFIGKPRGGKTYGVWERKGKGGRNSITLLVAFNPYLNHKKLLSWEKLNIKIVKNNMYKEFNKQFKKRIERKGSI